MFRVILSSVLLVLIQHVNAQDAPRDESSATILRPMSVPNEQERFTGTIVFPDGEVVTTHWRSVRSPNFVRFPAHEKHVELRELALKGNADAAFEAFRILDGCASTLDETYSIEENIAALRELRSKPENRTGSQAESVQEMEHRFELMREHDANCRRIERSSIENREELLRLAAQRGVNNARTWLGETSTDLKEAIELLEESWASGSLRSLRLLAHRYQQRYAEDGDQFDRVRAFAALYANATLLENGQTLKGRTANELTPRAWSAVEAYARQLDERTIQEGSDVAQTMISRNSNCCSQ